MQSMSESGGPGSLNESASRLTGTVTKQSMAAAPLEPKQQPVQKQSAGTSKKREPRAKRGQTSAVPLFPKSTTSLAPASIAGIAPPVAAPSASAVAAPASLGPAVIPNAQQQLLWQQAIQSFSLLPAQQQQALTQQASYLALTGATTGLPLSVGMPGVTPQLASVTTAAAALPPILTPSSAPEQSMAPAQGTKRTAPGRKLESFQSNKRTKSASHAAPSVVSSYSSSDAAVTKLTDTELESMTQAQRRRYERNLREQQRSHKISQQIKQLRDVLTESNVPFKPNKFSILVSVADYIKDLQARAIMLDADHQRLADTIQQTNDLVSSGRQPGSSEEEEESSADNKDLATTPLSSSESSPDFLLVQGIDYEAVFRHCPYPLAISSLDGRILACNPSFERVMGHEGGQMVQQSLFLYIRNHQEIFEAMASLLKRSSVASETGEDSVGDTSLLYWCGNVVSSQHAEISLNITLTGMEDGNPKYFSFAIATTG